VGNWVIRHCITLLNINKNFGLMAIVVYPGFVPNILRGIFTSPGVYAWGPMVDN
jgi:hypothetical protein